MNKSYSKHIKVTLRLLRDQSRITPPNHVMIATILNHIRITEQIISVSPTGSGSGLTIAIDRQIMSFAMYIGWLVTCGIDYSFTP